VLTYDFEESVGYWLTIATQSFHRAIGEEMAPHGITFRQSYVLFLLVLHGEMSQAELAAKMMVEPPTLVGILDRMERDGWITRNSCPTDRRKKIIRPTAAAEPIWEKITESGRRVRMQAIHGLTDREFETLRQLLRRVHKNLESLTPVESIT
jgi:MarR family transcriptional regulator for hemolysin